MEQNQEVEKKRFSRAHENQKWTENLKQKTTRRPFNITELIKNKQRMELSINLHAASTSFTQKLLMNYLQLLSHKRKKFASSAFFC